MDQTKISVERMIDGIAATMNNHQQSLVPTAETQVACAAFVHYMHEVWGPLPIDPVMLLISYNRYQSALAAEACTIECLDVEAMRHLGTSVRSAVTELQALTGGSAQQSADAIGLIIRGIAEQWAKYLDR